MVVVTKDREDEVRRLLVSVAAQGKVPDKIVFVDSSDSSLLKDAAVEILKDKCPPVELVLRKCTLPEGRNIGIDRCKCDLVSFIDDDAVLDPGYFASIESFLGSDSTKAIAGVEGEITNVYKSSIGMHSFWWAFNALFYLSYPGKGTYRQFGTPEAASSLLGSGAGAGLVRLEHDYEARGAREDEIRRGAPGRWLEGGFGILEESLDEA